MVRKLHRTVDSLMVKCALYGGAIGDSYGVPYEYSSAYADRGSFTPKWTSTTETKAGLIGDAPMGTWSDDTSMVLATIDALATDDSVNTDSMLENYRRWVYEGKWTCDGKCTDVGGTVSRALETGVGLDDEWSQGNGSLMRTWPLALTDATDEEIAAASAVTHAHPVCKAICVQWCWLLRGLAGNLPVIAAAEAAYKKAHDNGLDEVLRSPDGPCVDLETLVDRKEIDLKSGGFVVDAMETALWLLLYSSSHHEVIQRAVALGGDTDTIASIAGTAAGLAWGYDEDDVYKLRRMDLLEHAVRQFLSIPMESVVSD